jgi:YfiH family protein
MLLQPEWPAVPGVSAAMSLRAGGVSAPPFDSCNISRGVGDAPEAVAENRRRFAAQLGAQPVWMRLVHGAQVLRLVEGGPEHPETPADAAWTTARGIACTVTAADCLPVFFALRDGSAVGAVHAGWRGLASGVLEATLQAICAGTGARPGDVQAWLGPCIGPRQFEVGADVRLAFGAGEFQAASARHFRSRPLPDGSPRWLADLRGLAHDRLLAADVAHISASTACTVEDPSRFFSFRRDRVTGRHAAAIWRS